MTALGKGHRGFLGQVVPDDAADRPALVFARELAGVGAPTSRPFATVDLAALLLTGPRVRRRGCFDRRWLLVKVVYASNLAFAAENSSSVSIPCSWSLPSFSSCS